MKRINFIILSIGLLVTAATIQAQVCRSYIPFAFDYSLALTPEKFESMKDFILNTFLTKIFPIDIPIFFAPFSTNAGLWERLSMSKTRSLVENQLQDNSSDSWFVNSAAHLPQNSVVFTGGSLRDEYFEEVKNNVINLTANGNTVIVVFLKPNMNQTNYKRIPELKFVEWSNDSEVLLANIKRHMNCFKTESTYPTIITTHPPKTTTPVRMTTTSPSVSVCKSHIPFAYDVSQSLTADQYIFEKQLILNPFLSALFSPNVQPSWFGIFDASAYFPKSRPNNVQEIVNFINLYPQLSGKTGNLDVILKHLLARDILSDNDGLPVNTVIFTGSNLPSNKIEATIHLVNSFSSLNNTLILIFIKPNINQKNYEAVALVSKLVLIQYNQNKQQMAANLRKAMICA